MFIAERPKAARGKTLRSKSRRYKAMFGSRLFESKPFWLLAFVAALVEGLYELVQSARLLQPLCTSNANSSHQLACGAHTPRFEIHVFVMHNGRVPRGRSWREVKASFLFFPDRFSVNDCYQYSSFQKRYQFSASTEFDVIKTDDTYRPSSLKS